MKVLHIINEMDMGGAQSLLVELLPVQQSLGNEIAVLELRSNSDRTLVKVLESKGIKVISLSKRRSVRNPINVFCIIPYLKRFDIVHVHLFPANYWTALAKMLSFSRTPIITTEHSTNNKRRKIAIFKYIDQFIYCHYQEIVACADKALETFKARFENVNVVAIPNGVDISKYKEAQPYTIRELLGLEENVCLVTMVARFKYPKRQDTLIEAIAKLPDYFHAILVGGERGERRVQDMELLARQLGVEKRIHFLYLRNDVPRILKTSNIILMASDYEGLSLSSIEGMACGHPFIASNVNGLKDVVEGAGVLFENGNSKELADLLLKLSTDEEFYNLIVNRCLQRASIYDIHVVAQQYQNQYNKFVIK